MRHINIIHLVKVAVVIYPGGTRIKKSQYHHESIECIVDLSTSCGKDGPQADVSTLRKASLA